MDFEVVSSGSAANLRTFFIVVLSIGSGRNRREGGGEDAMA